MNLLGDVSHDWWVLLVGFGFFVVGAIAIVLLVRLFVDRDRNARV